MTEAEPAAKECPARHQPDLTCFLGRIMQRTEEGELVWWGTCPACVKATGGKEMTREEAIKKFAEGFRKRYDHADWKSGGVIRGAAKIIYGLEAIGVIKLDVEKGHDSDSREPKMKITEEMVNAAVAAYEADGRMRAALEAAFSKSGELTDEIIALRRAMHELIVRRLKEDK